MECEEEVMCNDITNALIESELTGNPPEGTH